MSLYTISTISTALNIIIIGSFSYDIISSRYFEEDNFIGFKGVSLMITKKKTNIYVKTRQHYGWCS